MAEGMWRDQVLAGRSEMRANYGFDDMQKVMEILIGAFQDPLRNARAS
jgi:hypothetical protein